MHEHTVRGFCDMCTILKVYSITASCMGVAFIFNSSLHCYILAEDCGTVGYPAQLQIVASQVFVQRLFQNQHIILKLSCVHCMTSLWCLDNPSNILLDTY